MSSLVFHVVLGLTAVLLETDLIVRKIGLNFSSIQPGNKIYLRLLLYQYCGFFFSLFGMIQRSKPEILILIIIYTYKLSISVFYIFTYIYSGIFMHTIRIMIYFLIVGNLIKTIIDIENKKTDNQLLLHGANIEIYSAVKFERGIQSSIGFLKMIWCIDTISYILILKSGLPIERGGIITNIVSLATIVLYEMKNLFSIKTHDLLLLVFSMATASTRIYRTFHLSMNIETPWDLSVSLYVVYTIHMFIVDLFYIYIFWTNYHSLELRKRYKKYKAEMERRLYMNMLTD